jgi:hypothetical protein
MVSDLQSEAKAPVVKAPVAWVARRLLASDPSVRTVTVIADNGKVLTYESVADDNEGDPFATEGHRLIYYVPASGLTFCVRLGKGQSGTQVPTRIEAMLRSPSPLLTR